MPATALHRTLRLLAVGSALLLATACGDDGGGEPEATGSVPEMAFLTGMVEHHRSAISMARMARERGRDPFVTELAADIIRAQRRETDQMRAIHRRLFGETLVPDPLGHEGLGLTAEEAGMAHAPRTMRMLRSARPFDRAFVDEMVPHHRGAIRMATVILDSTEDPELRQLAEDIVSAQRREVEQMNSFRTEKYGGPVPASPGERASEDDQADEMGEHGGH
jgi:uncharacterized protein (DUF305 family)